MRVHGLSELSLSWTSSTEECQHYNLRCSFYGLQYYPVPNQRSLWRGVGRAFPGVGLSVGLVTQECQMRWIKWYWYSWQVFGYPGFQMGRRVGSVPDYPGVLANCWWIDVGIRLCGEFFLIDCESLDVSVSGVLPEYPEFLVTDDDVEVPRVMTDDVCQMWDTESPPPPPPPPPTHTHTSPCLLLSDWWWI